MRQKETRAREENFEEGEQSWDIKRIGIFLVVFIGVVVGGFFLKQTYYPQASVMGAQTTTDMKDKTQQSVKEQTVTPAISLLRPQDMQKKLEEIKNQITSIDPIEVASSSPQVQKVLDDIKALQNYPKNQVKEWCDNICKSF